MAARPCTCEDRCPGSLNCTCIEIIGPPKKCNCDCGFVAGAPGELTILEADQEINLDVRGSDLEAVAAFILRFTDAEVSVPESAEGDRVDVSLEGVTFAHAVDALGLVLRPSTPGEY